MAGRIGDDGLTKGKRRNDAIGQAFLLLSSVDATKLPQESKDALFSARGMLAKHVDPAWITEATQRGILGLYLLPQAPNGPVNAPVGYNAGKQDAPIAPGK